MRANFNKYLVPKSFPPCLCVSVVKEPSTGPKDTSPA